MDEIPRTVWFSLAVKRGGRSGGRIEWYSFKLSSSDDVRCGTRDRDCFCCRHVHRNLRDCPTLLSPEAVSWVDDDDDAAADEGGQGVGFIGGLPLPWGEVYDPLTNQWTALPDPPTRGPTTTMAAAVGDDHGHGLLLLLLLLLRPSDGDLYQYDAVSNSWKVYHDIPKPQKRRFPYPESIEGQPSVVAVGRNLYWFHAKKGNLFAFDLDRHILYSSDLVDFTFALGSPTEETWKIVMHQSWAILGAIVSVCYFEPTLQRPTPTASSTASPTENHSPNKDDTIIIIMTADTSSIVSNSQLPRPSQTD
ncbi:hypothetical protein Tsubulata_001051 [Turnera subulata]|uniref:Uncharacterized protein n=1 Tax=Turnera subulata TaxID=218843 RepID=A0A9Q0FMJ8_9ROSI|nr:hypothetical protein Tsubulata_001051 [Turnera subulata]